jgi:hypothetical protein
MCVVAIDDDILTCSQVCSKLLAGRPVMLRCTAHQEMEIGRKHKVEETMTTALQHRIEKLEDCTYAERS